MPSNSKNSCSLKEERWTGLVWLVARARVHTNVNSPQLLTCLSLKEFEPIAQTSSASLAKYWFCQSNCTAPSWMVLLGWESPFVAPWDVSWMQNSTEMLACPDVPCSDSFLGSCHQRGTSAIDKQSMTGGRVCISSALRSLSLSPSPGILFSTSMKSTLPFC